MKKKEFTLPTLLGLFIALGGLVAGIWLVRGQLRGSLQASPEESPQKVTVTNVGDTTATISWITDKAVSGYIKFGEQGRALNSSVSDQRDQRKGEVENYFTHYMQIQGLKPQTKYQFKIGTGKGVYNYDGKPYEFSTAGVLSTEPAADVAYGQAVTSNGEAAEGAIIYLQIPGAVTQSTIVKASGAWVIPLSKTRAATLEDIAPYDISTTQLELRVEAGPMGSARMSLTTDKDSPAPQLVISSDETETAVQTPATPGSEKKTSKLSISEEEQEDENSPIKVVSPKSGEKVNTLRPEIMGKAPAGAEITIEIHSEAVIVGATTADDNGDFVFSVPEDLPPGPHTLTITSLINGVTSRITKTFTVYAVGESLIPAYSSTPSATLAITRTPSPTQRPTAGSPTPTTIRTATSTPTPRAAGLPSATPKASATPTTVSPVPTETETPSETELPSSGVFENTLALLALSGILITGGGWWWRKRTG